MVKFKKSIAMLLAVALMISCLPLSVFAADAEPASITATCNHPVTTHYDYVLQVGQGYYQSPSQCVYRYQERVKCTSCNKIISTSSFIQELGGHSKTISSASCDGRIQTHHLACGNCHYGMGTTTVACPNAPHTGNCIALPASVDIPAEKY